MKSRTTERTAPKSANDRERRSEAKSLSSVDRELKRLFALELAGDESGSDERRGSSRRPSK